MNLIKSGLRMWGTAVYKGFLVFALFFSTLYCTDPQKDLYEKFIKSFVVHYDFSPEGRYTHEYHPFLLAQTRNSLQQLEQRLIGSGFDCKGRIVVMGYQQEGVPSYSPDVNQAVLSDEASLQSKRGRVVPAHNIFGFLTGFLLKDVNWFQKQWDPEQPLIIEHVLPERIDLFDDYAYIFQKHAFGKDFEMLLKDRKAVEKSLKKRDPAAVLEMLINFWQRAYKGELKSCGQEVLATQDILFSIDYAQHLVQSAIPVTKLYVGPDITYPIEILSFQQQAATESAQYFVKLFSERLQAYDGKNTAYIFCSFVDGVGKSTLLGNVINWSKHQDTIGEYERVDNASSQKGVLYPLKEHIFIMDLPAQLSHWVGKPDGQVFVDIACVSDISAQQQTDIKGYVLQTAATLEQDFQEYKRTYSSCPSVPVDDVLGLYVKNVLLFKPEIEWVPFRHKQHVCIYNHLDLSQVRVLVPLEGVHSKGLKTAQPEQMLFTKGLMIPLTFEVFMDDVVDQFKKAGIENIVFVDFLSMYPRSSRENVRVIFMLQQLKKIYEDHFSVEMSLYRSFVNRETELYHLILFNKEAFLRSLFLESMSRALLYSIFTQTSSTNLTLLSFDEVTALLKKETPIFCQKAGTYLSVAVQKKIETEHGALERYAYDKKYELFTLFSVEPLYAFSAFMEDLFGHRIMHPYFSGIWQGMEASLSATANSIQVAGGQGNAAIKAALACNVQLDGGTQYLESGVQVRCLEIIPTACRDAVTLAPFLSLVRAHWYTALANLLECETTDAGRLLCTRPSYTTPPLVLREIPGQRCVCLQKYIDTTQTKPPYNEAKNLFLFNNYSWCMDMPWGEWNGSALCIEWSGVETFFGPYAFGYDWDRQVVKTVVDRERTKKVKLGYQDPAVFAADVVRAFDREQVWQQFAEGKECGCELKKRKLAVNSPQGRAVGLWIRSVATLEMIIKDALTPIIVRRGVREDFVAALRLLEKVTLPRYFGIYLDKNMFSDYYAVEPVIPLYLA